MNSIFTPTDFHCGRFVRLEKWHYISFVFAFISFHIFFSLSSCSVDCRPDQREKKGSKREHGNRGTDKLRIDEPNICPNSMHQLYTFMDVNKNLRFDSSFPVHSCTVIANGYELVDLTRRYVFMWISVNKIIFFTIGHLAAEAAGRHVRRLICVSKYINDWCDRMFVCNIVSCYHIDRHSSLLHCIDFLITIHFHIHVWSTSTHARCKINDATAIDEQSTVDQLGFARRMRYVAVPHQLHRTTVWECVFVLLFEMC